MKDKVKRKIIAIVGPTATGKTAIGVALAKAFDGEIISADSRQVYRGLDLGTGKDLAEYDGVKYHLIDIVDPEKQLTLFDYLPLARAAIEDIFSRGKLPIIVGGTGLYVQGIVEGFELRIQKSEFRSQKFKSPVSPTACRGGKVNNFSRMELEAKTVPELNQILQEIDPRKAEKVDRKNAHRLIRAIEISQSGLIPTKIKPDFEVLQIGLDIPRNILHERIDRRVDERFESGMLEEVEGLINAGVSTEWLVGLGLEYRVMTEFLISQKSEVKSQKFNSEVDNLDTTAQLNLSLENNKTRSTSPLDKLEVNNEAMKQWSNEFSQMKQQLKFRIHQFARRQITWFRRFSEINWLKDLQEIKRYVKIFTEH